MWCVCVSVTESSLLTSLTEHVCVHPLLHPPLQNKGFSPVTMCAGGLPAPLSIILPGFQPSPPLSVSPTTIQQQLARSHGIARQPLSPSPLSHLFCCCMTSQQRIKGIQYSAKSPDTQCAVWRGGQWKMPQLRCSGAASQFNSILRAAIDVSVNDDDRSKGNNQGEYIVICSTTGRVCVCVKVFGSVTSAALQSCSVT